MVFFSSVVYCLLRSPNIIISRENVDCTNVGSHLTRSGALQPLKHYKCILNTISASNNYGWRKQHVCGGGVLPSLTRVAEDYGLCF